MPGTMLEWDRRRRRSGKVPMLTWVVLSLLVGIAGFVIWAFAQPKKTDLLVSLVVFTDDVGLPPEPCLTYERRHMEVEDSSGLVVWSGAMANANPHIRVPDLGCEFLTAVSDIPVSERYRITIEGLGSHVFSKRVLDENYHIAQWPSICVEDSTPCALPDQQGTAIG